MEGDRAKGLDGGDTGRKSAGAGISGGRGKLVWESSLPSAPEVETLRRRFPEVISVSREPVMAQADLWAASAVVARSLGRRVSVDTFLRELRRWPELRGEVSGAHADNGIAILRFSEPGDRDRVLMRPWTVAGQAMAVEPWRPWFFPRDDAISSAKVWVRLPGLPVEFWSGETLAEILGMAGRLVSVDEWTANRRRLGFARACVAIDLAKPLRPGVLLQGEGGTYWQAFIYECLDGVCLGCARFHGPTGCTEAGRGGSGSGLSAANLTEAMEDGSRPSEAGPVLGPWAVAVRRWLPPVAEGGPSRRSGLEREGSLRGSQGPEAGKTPSQGTGWQTPSKVARRSPQRRQASPKAGAGSAGRFGPLVLVQERPETGKEIASKRGGEGVLALTKSKAPLTPETLGAGRAVLGAGREALRIKAPGSIFGPSVIPGVRSSKEPGSTSSKRARADEEGMKCFSGSTLSGASAKGGGRRGGSRKSKGTCTKPASLDRGKRPVTEGQPGLFVFDAGSAMQLGPPEGGLGGEPASSLGGPDHDVAVHMVEEALSNSHSVISQSVASIDEAPGNVQPHAVDGLGQST